ncbi:hypothetical protein Patl1_13184 [Pistacia atlantica]|uniref:Uncharacterized protein n=1 Tax=Pistacia atlantica TaxID=434234 RepID=A0ACC1AS03_9ROSI|nr:hypothetical protein Patl1_13184 [Pistacia atlantica]
MIQNLRWRFSQNSTKGLQRSGMGCHQTSQKLAKLAKFLGNKLSNVWRVDGDVMGVVAIEILIYGCGCISARGGVAKRTSVFDDPTLEIQELTALVKQDISALNSALVDLQFLSNSQNESGNISSDTTTHSTTVVDNLKNRLMGTTKEFKEVPTMWIRCTIRSLERNLKVHENRRQLFSSTASKESTNPFIRQRPLASRSAAEASTTPPPPPWANANQQMGNLSHYCSSSIINNNSSWRLHYKTATCRVELKPFIMWNQLSMNWVTFLHNWQAWYHGKERLQSGLTRTWTIHYQMWKERRTNWPDVHESSAQGEMCTRVAHRGRCAWVLVGAKDRVVVGVVQRQVVLVADDRESG